MAVDHHRFRERRIQQADGVVDVVLDEVLSRHAAGTTVAAEVESEEVPAQHQRRRQRQAVLPAARDTVQKKQRGSRRRPGGQVQGSLLGVTGSFGKHCFSGSPASHLVDGGAQAAYPACDMLHAACRIVILPERPVKERPEKWE